MTMLTDRRYDTTATLESLRNQAEEFERRKVDFIGMPMFNEKARLVPLDKNTGIGEYEFGMTEWAISQLCTKLGPGTFGRGSNRMLPKDAVMRWMDTEAFRPHIAGILNENVRRVEANGTTWFIRTYGEDVRAILSERYAPVSNTEVINKTLEAVQLLEEQHGSKLDLTIVRPWNTPDDLSLKVIVNNLNVLPSGEKAPYGIGFHTHNNETGRGGIGVSPLIQKFWCTNSIVFMGDEDATFRSTHRGIPEVIVGKLALAIANALKLSAEYLEDYLQLRTVQLPDIFSQISKMAERNSWSTDFTDAVRSGIEDQRTVAGLVDGLTFAAHKIYSNDPEQMVTWEAMAGGIVSNPQVALTKMGVLVPAYANLPTGSTTDI
jgi:hypothetical protein